MNIFKRAFSFLTVGRTQETAELSNNFKRYVGVGSSYILAVNPNKKQLDELMGYESQAEPEYIKSDDKGKYLNLTFIVRTDPATNNDIEITNRAIITMRPLPAYNSDQTKVRVIDEYGNYAWADTEVAKAGGALPNNTKIGKYRIAYVGECLLVEFLKKYLNVPEAFDYINGSWVKKDNGKDADGLFSLEHVKDYFTGNVSEIRDAIALQPNNKVKLLYGVRTTDDNKQYQTVLMREQFILGNNAGPASMDKLKDRLKDAKNNGAFTNTDYRVSELTNYAVPNIDFSDVNINTNNTSELPWD